MVQTLLQADILSN